MTDFVDIMRGINTYKRSSKLIFPELSFEEMKIIAAQFIERIEVTEDSAEIKWAV